MFTPSPPFPLPMQNRCRCAKGSHTELITPVYAVGLGAAGALGKGSGSERRGTSAQKPGWVLLGTALAVFAGSGAVTAHVWDGERREGGSGSAWLEDGVVGARVL